MIKNCILLDLLVLFFVIVLRKIKKVNKTRSAVMIQQTGFGYFFKNLEYPCPYWTLRDTRLRVAEEMLDCAMT